MPDAPKHLAPKSNTQNKSPLVLILGGGATGFYSAERLMEAGFDVVMINQDIAIGGGTRFFIRYDKSKMKLGLLKTFEKALENPRFKGYYGGVRVGIDGDVDLDSLMALNPFAVLMATGSRGIKSLDIPGITLKGVHNAYDISQTYNGAPRFQSKPLQAGEHVSILGVGNVTADMIYWLAHEKKETVKTVTVFARRGPFEFKMTRKEVTEILPNIEPDAFVKEIDRNLDLIYQDRSLPYFAETLTDEETGMKTENKFRLTGNKDKDFEMVLKSMNLTGKEIAGLREGSGPGEREVKVRFRFLTQPVKLLAKAGDSDSLGEVYLTENRLVYDAKRKRIRSEQVSASQKPLSIPCEMFIYSIGSVIDPYLGLHHEEGWLVPAKENPYLFQHHNHTTGENHPYWAFGWARRPSKGLVGKAKLDVASGMPVMIEHLRKHQVKGGMTQADLEKLLRSKNIRWTSKETIRRIHLKELESKTLFTSGQIQAQLDSESPAPGEKTVDSSL